MTQPSAVAQDAHPAFIFSDATTRLNTNKVISQLACRDLLSATLMGPHGTRRGKTADKGPLGPPNRLGRTSAEVPNSSGQVLADLPTKSNFGGKLLRY